MTTATREVIVAMIRAAKLTPWLAATVMMSAQTVAEARDMIERNRDDAPAKDSAEPRR